METKPIKRSLRIWPLTVGAEQAKEIERKLAWHLHNELDLENHYLLVLKQHLDGNLPSIYRATKNGELIWSGPKELHYLGRVSIDKLFPEHGPSEKYRRAKSDIDKILRDNGWIQ